MSFSQDREADMMIKVRDSCAVKFFIILSSHINSGARDTPLSLYVCNSWNICIQYLQMFVDTCKNSHTCESRWLFFFYCHGTYDPQLGFPCNGTGQWYKGSDSGISCPSSNGKEDLREHGRAQLSVSLTTRCIPALPGPTLLHRDQWPPGCSVLE